MDNDAGIVQVTNFRGGLATEDAVNVAERHQDEAIDLKHIFKEFIERFRIHNDHLYMAMLRGNLAAGLFFIEVEMSHLQQFSSAVFDALHSTPTRVLPLFEHGVWELAQEHRLLPPLHRQSGMQLQLYWGVPPTPLRLLAQASVARLVCVSGIVVKVSPCHARCVRAAIQCTSCSSKTFINGGRNVDLPPHCMENGGRLGGGTTGPTGGQRKCRPNPYTLLPMECEYEDQQVIKLQELPEDVPTGELPRHVTVVVDRYLVDRVSAGSRVQLAGIVSEEAAFKRFAEQGNVYERLAQSIDPAIFGLQDQKKAIVCLLFGGTRKRQGSNYLRGDMNVLFIGDPSTAKSQLLKFTEKVAPIGIYTSGKGSSAAGLTASVISNGNGDFVLEAGSMVLADGGVVCIDEFDKMREQDQVAIHEAMEQQTISIAKANLTTMLNSRTSVLAAANPTLGSYDPLRSNEDQMDFQSSILSRFDLIFKVIDPRNPEIDNRLAQHVINLHKGGSSRHVHANATGALVERSFFTKYVSYARATRHPRISEDAMSVLLDFYVHARREAHQRTLEAISSSSGSKPQTPIIQITARQLESLVRITESMARMRLDVLANRSDAEEAIRLFKAATVDAIRSGVSDQSMTAAQSEVVLRIEEALRRRVALGATVEHSRLMSEMSRMGFDMKLVDRAVYAMTKREELEWRKQRTLIHRLR
uniref:DNA replication licensing factor MCM5 n=1 Tax=Trypanosoma vivax (strain Y486) TaxID=1055687 RepID=G0UBA5_TRYVY|nr:putative DNA replication licensing factor, fragment [Trypanosoma vivax Y486]